MKHQALITASLFLVIGTAVSAQSNHNTAWNGVWHSELGGQPGVILTLGDDTGQLGGTVVLNMVSRESGQPRVIGSDIHVLVNPRVSGNTLSFQFKRTKDGRELQMAVSLEADGKATIKCLNCGPDAPTAEMVRSN
jgi:hypothetical protein